MQKIVRLPQETLLTYLPGTLVDSWARRPHQSPIWGHWLDGSLMHCDISGFTAMSESLAGLGKEGAELMAGVLNRFFDTMLEVADCWGGVQMKFGGDAMLLFFSGRDHAASAAACGLEMQKGMAGFRRIMAGGQEHRLRMRAGIHSGRFFAASVGNRDGTLHYLLLGPDVNRTAAVEPIAGPDQVVVSAETAALLGPQHHLAGTAQRGIWRVRSAETPPSSLASPAPPRAPVDVLRRYLMPPLAEGRVTTVSGEHRRVTALFINIMGASSLLQTEGDGQALAQVDAYVKLLIDVLERNGGFLAASDVAEDGDKLIALFGAPVSHEHAEAAAVRSAWEIQAELQNSDLNLTQRIGINSGFVFAGEIGSRRRREYPGRCSCPPTPPPVPAPNSIFAAPVPSASRGRAPLWRYTGLRAPAPWSGRWSPQSSRHWWAENRRWARCWRCLASWRGDGAAGPTSQETPAWASPD